MSIQTSELPSAAPPAPQSATQSAPWTGYLLGGAGAALFSAKSVIIKLVYQQGVSTETLLALRMGLSVPIYLAIGAWALHTLRRRGAPMPRAEPLVKAALIGVLGYWFASYVDFLGLHFITAQFERLILFTYPGFVLLFGAAFFGQRIQPRALIGLGVSYAGLALIFTVKLDTLGSNVAKGAGLVLAAAVAFALYQILAKGVIAALGSRLFTCVAMSAAAAAALVQFVLTEPLSALAIAPSAMALSVFLAIGGTVLPSFLLNAALHRISAQANSVIGLVSPVITIALAMAVLKEPLSLIDALGAALVLAGVGGFSLADRRGAHGARVGDDQK